LQKWSAEAKEEIVVKWFHSQRAELTKRANLDKVMPTPADYSRPDFITVIPSDGDEKTKARRLTPASMSFTAMVRPAAQGANAAAYGWAPTARLSIAMNTAPCRDTARAGNPGPPTEKKAVAALKSPGCNRAEPDRFRKTNCEEQAARAELNPPAASGSARRRHERDSPIACCTRAPQPKPCRAGPVHGWRLDARAGSQTGNRGGRGNWA
jgi:hypothetical protein